MRGFSSWLIAGGLILIGIGIAVKLGIPLGRLPGDIRFEGDNFSFYFPLTTCILLSLLLSLLFRLFR
jgi:hypothetical protein